MRLRLCASLWGVVWVAAVTAVPLLLVPQLLLGGFVRSRSAFDELGPVHPALSEVTIQRWGFEAAVATDAYARDGVLRHWQ